MLSPYLLLLRYCFHGIGPEVSNPAWGVALTPHLHGIAARTTYQHLTHPHCWELASLAILRAITTGAFRFHQNSYVDCRGELRWV
jgi:hypothetical protein